MSTDAFKTGKGTVLPLMNLKGKPYLQVAHRIVWFREDHPLGRFESECIVSTDKFVIYKATVSVPSKDGSYVKLADAVKREDFSHFADAHEKAQTGAIGRALAMIGYGTQFAPEFDEGERLADAPTARATRQADALAEEMIREGTHNGPSGYRITFGQYRTKTLEQVGPRDLANYIEYLEKQAAKEGKTITGKVAEFIEEASAYIAAFENGGAA